MTFADVVINKTSSRLLQPTLTLEKDRLALERPSRAARQPKKKQRIQAEPELSESDEYADFPEPRQSNVAEFNTVIVGEETETSSAVQSIQQVSVLNCSNTHDLLVYEAIDWI